MHNRRSTTTCFRLTMVALKLYAVDTSVIAEIELSLNHGRVETNL